jgi:hypothetical protein
MIGFPFLGNELGFMGNRKLMSSIVFSISIGILNN